MLTPLLFLLQSVTPFGSPVDPILTPRNESRSSLAEGRFNQCVDLAIDDPAAGISEANQWRIEGGTFLARHCLGFAYAEQGNWALASKAFVEAAREAEVVRYERTANFWAQAGNAALADGKAEDALSYLNAALVQGTLKELDKGEVHLDRARAYVALEQYDAAKTEFIQVHALAPQDPLGWLLSATLARRTGDLEQAKKDIERASRLAGADPAVALEAGNIAYKAGDTVGAKANWEQAVKLNADSTPAKAASRYLAQLVTSVEE